MPSYRRVPFLVVAPSPAVAIAMFSLYVVVLPQFPSVRQHDVPESTATYATPRVAILGDTTSGGVHAVSVAPAETSGPFLSSHGVIVAPGRFEQLYPLLGWVGGVPSVATGVLLARRYVAGRGRRRLAAPATSVPGPAALAEVNR